MNATGYNWYCLPEYRVEIVEIVQTLSENLNPVSLSLSSLIYPSSCSLNTVLFSLSPLLILILVACSKSVTKKNLIALTMTQHIR